MQTDEVALVVFLCSDSHTVSEMSSAVIILAKILGSLSRKVPKLRFGKYNTSSDI